MPRLSRVHFCGIGHRDARLDPLTLDFRAEDSVLWLRNGGGKSSILNLFYSVFRPALREFLGSRAEAGHRALHQYVGDRDLACVITEWTDQERGLFGLPEEGRLVLGQALAWRGGERSSDTSRLQRLFFGFRSRAGLRLDDLPLRGLHDSPVTSLDAFKDVLDASFAAHPGCEGVHTWTQRTWLDHLERVSVDPELFRYQVEMNQREGAADERFRFATAQEFIAFFLEMTLDPSAADQVSQNLDQLRLQLARRPEQRLELEFLEATLHALGPLSVALEQRRQAEEARSRDLAEGQAFACALKRSQARLEADAERAEQQAAELASAARRHENARDLHRRYARGLGRRALELELDEAEAEEMRRRSFHAQVQRRKQVLHAARQQVEVRALETAVATLRDELAREQAERAPEEQALAQVGGRLQAALRVASSEAQAAAETQRAEAEEWDAHKVEAQRASHALTREEAEADARRKEIERQLRARDEERERLRDRGQLLLQEAPEVALSRWQQARAGAERALVHLREEQGRTREALQENQAEQRTAAAALAELRAALKQERSALDAAQERRRGLATRPRMRALTEVDEADVFTEGLVGLLRSRAEAHHREVLRVEVDGAEARRTIAAIRETHLAPPSRDAQRVLEALDEVGVRAFAGTAWLAETRALPDRRAHLEADPARYAGVIVQRQADLERARGLAPEGLSGPVMVALAQTALAPPEEAVVLGPEGDAAFDPVAAGQALDALQAADDARAREVQAQRQQQRDHEQLADELSAFLEAFGGGRLDRMAEQLEQREAEEARQRAASERLAAEAASLGQRLTAIDGEQRTERDREREAARAAEALEGFIERHEQALEARRDELERLRARLRALPEAKRAAEAERASFERLAREAVVRARDHDRDARVLGDEFAEVSPASSFQGDASELSLSDLRVEWRNRKQSFDARFGASRLQGRLDGKLESLAAAQRELDKRSQGLDSQHVAQAAQADGPTLERQLEEAEGALSDAAQAMGQATAAVKVARERVEDTRGRRDAQDLPPDTDPTCSAEARRLAEEQRDRGEQESQRAETAREAERSASEAGVRASRRAQAHAHSRELLETALPEAPEREVQPASLPERDEDIKRHAGALRARIEASVEALRLAEDDARRRGEQVRKLAFADRFEAHRSQFKERLQDPVDELMRRAPELAEDLERRRVVLTAQLAQLERQREQLVQSLATVADGALYLINTLERVSELPAGLGAWSGRPFVIARLSVPKTQAERDARLGILVDELVQRASIPGGLELSQRAVGALVGPQGARVSILKPDATMREERNPIQALSSFSRGQQLTAAILLYCTLAQLRARQRGRGRGSAPAGVLILDNPIGTCSSVPLLELQRRVGQAMRVQLVYTTGVEDRDAIATLANTIRLRNRHRDRVSGAHHVTQEGVEGVQVGFKEST